MKDFKPDLDFILSRPGVLRQYRVLGFMKACVLHDAGEMTDEEYALWKSKFPAFLDDFREFRKRAGREEEENFGEDIPVPPAEPKPPERRRQRKINSGR